MIHCSSLPPEDWRALPLVPQYRFGWTPPFSINADGIDVDVIVIISPQVIDEVTAHLDENDLEMYLTVIELAVGTYLQLRGLAPEAIERELEELLMAATALPLRSAVEMHALDAGIVPTNH